MRRCGPVARPVELPRLQFAIARSTVCRLSSEARSTATPQVSGGRFFWRSVAGVPRMLWRRSADRKEQSAGYSLSDRVQLDGGLDAFLELFRACLEAADHVGMRFGNISLFQWIPAEMV